MQLTPFTTDDGHLAIALIVAQQKFLGGVNEYTEEIVTRAGFKSANEMRNAGRPGVVNYFFERTPEIEGLKVAFFDQKRSNDGGATSETKSEIFAEDLVKIACAVLAVRGQVAPLWKNPKRFFQIFKQGGERSLQVTDSITATPELLATLPPGHAYKVGDEIPTGATLNVSAATIVTLGLDRETRKHLGL